MTAHRSSPSSLTTAAIAAVRDVGRWLRKGYGCVTGPIHDKTGNPVDVATQFDMHAEQYLAERLTRYDPTIGFTGEETGHRGPENRRWLVDPIDGTAWFIRGHPFCTTMLALVEDDTVTFSIIYNFVTGELFVAKKGEGAYCNDVALHVSERGLREAYLSFETDVRKEKNLETFMALRRRAVIVSTICAGYEFGLVAQGILDARVCLDPFGHAHDFAAGTLLVSEAGGVVTNIGAETYSPWDLNFIAANPRLHADLSAPDSPLAPHFGA